MEAFGRIWALGCTSMLVYGAFEWVRGPENDQNYQIYDFKTLLRAFSLQKT